MGLRRYLCTCFGFFGSALITVTLYFSVCFGYPYSNGMGDIALVENVKPTESTFDVSDSISLPINIPGTTLILERMVLYEGPFLEDFSDREVVNISAVHLYNTGNTQIQNAYVEVKFEEDVHQFYAEYIPGKKSVLVLEMNGKQYNKSKLTNVIGCAALGEAVTSENEGIQVDEIGMDVLSVSNVSNKEFKNIIIYYKSWLSDPEIYVGGITYSVRIPALSAGESVLVYPYHYVRGYSKVVSVKTDCME